MARNARALTLAAYLGLILGCTHVPPNTQVAASPKPVWKTDDSALQQVGRKDGEQPAGPNGQVFAVTRWLLSADGCDRGCRVFAGGEWSKFSYCPAKQDVSISDGAIVPGEAATRRLLALGTEAVESVPGADSPDETELAKEFENLNSKHRGQAVMIVYRRGAKLAAYQTAIGEPFRNEALRALKAEMDALCDP
jgi:hypothetical protein